MNEKDIKDMTAREVLEIAVKDILAADSDVETFILAVKTKGKHGLSCVGSPADIEALLTLSALDKKFLRPIIHQASVDIKFLERVYDAEASDRSAAITLTKEQLEQLLKKGGKA